MPVHSEHHFQSSELVTDIVIGMSDGLTVPFALAAGLSGAVSSTHIIVIAGLAEIVAGSIAMGLGGYLAGKTEIDHYNAEVKREVYEVEHMPEKEKEEVREIFANMGMSPETQHQVVEEMAKDKEKWGRLYDALRAGAGKARCTAGTQERAEHWCFLYRWRIGAACTLFFYSLPY